MTRRVIILAVISVLLSCLLSGFDSVAVETEREQAVFALEPVVQAIAERGPGVLFERQTRSDLRAAGGESTLFSLLGAWSKLSIGRIGLLQPEASARLPWLVLAALAPVALYASVAPVWGSSFGIYACAWLVAFPGWMLASARGAQAAALAGAWLVTYALYLRSLPRWRGMRSRHPQRWTALCLVSFAIGLAMSRATLAVLLVLYVDFALRDRALVGRAEQRGFIVVPTALALSLVIAPIAFVGLDPVLYGAPASAIVSAAFAPIRGQDFSLWQFVLPAIALVGARLSAQLCSKFVPQRLTTAAQFALLAIVASANLVV